MKVFLSFLLGVLLGVVGTWVVLRTQPSTTVGVEPEVRDRIDAASDKVGDSLERAGESIRDTASEVGDKLSDATADARITAEIKSKLIRETALNAFRIDVDTSDRVVTLSGTVASSQDVERAIEIARATEGVREVASTLQVRAGE